MLESSILLFVVIGLAAGILAGVFGIGVRLAFGVFVVVLGVSLMAGAFRRLGWV